MNHDARDTLLTAAWQARLEAARQLQLADLLESQARRLERERREGRA